MSESCRFDMNQDKIYVIITKAGARRVGKWSDESNGFHFCDHQGEGFILIDDALDWWPASIRF